MNPRNRPTIRQVLPLAALVVLVASCVPVSANRDNHQGSPPHERAAAGAPLDKSPVKPGGPSAPATYIAEGRRAGVGGCPVYPRNNVFHADISGLPVTADSRETIAAAGADLPLKSPTSFVWQGSRPGLPINLVDSRELPLIDVFPGKYSYMSDLEDHPVPPAPRIEGDPGMAWDRHMLLVDTATCTTSEFFYVTPPNPFFNMWTAATVVKMDLTSNAIRARGSANAAGTSLLGGMIRYDEVVSGRLDHMIGASLPTVSKQGPLWPATRTDGRSDDPVAPRMGTVFRLRSDVDLSGFGRDALVIAEALQTHGLMVGDSGPAWVNLAIENDPGWGGLELSGLSDISLADFEVVDAQRMKVSGDSFEIR